jgi:ketosteroid isomerase-like protein
MSDAALRVVFDHLHARRMGDAGAIGASLDPDVVHQGVVPSLVCNGRDAVMERMHSRIEGIDSGIERLELIAAGERVIVGIAGPRFDEVPFLDGEIFMLFTLRDGRILRIDDYRSREDAVRAAEVAAP